MTRIGAERMALTATLLALVLILYAHIAYYFRHMPG
jgi:hypothetical protein